jgi:hypothetical protein
MTKKILAPLLLALALGTPACVGPNNAFNSVASWNSRATESRFVNELIFLGLWIFPVYEVALLGDVVVFNSIEFWGSSNPVETPREFEYQGEK